MNTKRQINILLVDDDDDVLNTLSEMFERGGWRCLKAPTGEIALDSFKINEIDVVILDLNLPRMDGFEVLKQMKGLKPAVPIVILTAVGYEKDQVDKALKFGAAGYINKAMPVKQTIAAIKTALLKK